VPLAAKGGDRLPEKITVLIADDDVAFCQHLICAFGSKSDIEVVGCTHNGEKTLEVLLEETTPPDFVILDLILPCLDGIAVLNRYFSSSRNTSCRFIAVSPMLETPALAKVVNDAGAATYMMKPLYPERLIAQIRRLYRGEEPADQTCLGSVIHKDVIAELRRLGVPAHYKGYPYLGEAIKQVCLQPGLMNNMTTGVYRQVACLFNTSSERVERSVRHAIETGCVRGDLDYIAEVFGSSLDSRKGKPTNAAFISTLADRIRLKYGLHEIE